MFCGEQGKGGKYFEQENIFISEEKEKEENIWRRKKKKKNGEGKLMVTPTNQPTNRPTNRANKVQPASKVGK